MKKTHFGQHGDECFGCRIQSVSFAASAMPTRKPQAAAEPAREKALVRDRTAFKAMRDQGIQPARLKGAADLQDRATTKHEIETGKIIGNASLAAKVESTVKEMANQ
jgi:hypothetical protein